uniref:Uncharacterized protein n=1 Tax=Anguilla anguilla TaxID=7936 RepID=A0A0E9Q1Q7_ANGAN
MAQPLVINDLQKSRRFLHQLYEQYSSRDTSSALILQSANQSDVCESHMAAVQSKCTTVTLALQS